MQPSMDDVFRRHCAGIADYMRVQYQQMKVCDSRQALDTIWGDILVHRLALQDYCEELILMYPETANSVSADRYLWKYVYYDAIIECRKRLKLHVPLHNLSHMSSITGSMRSSEYMGSNDGSVTRSSRSNSDGVLEDWQREWWAVTLTTLFNEALGYFQSLYSRVSSMLREKPLGYAMLHVHVEQYRLPPVFMIARRLCMYVGDVYRYQYMYLPLLSFSDIGPVDTDNILNLARWTYGRAKAMYFDNGRACVQIALLSAYSHKRFDSVFWQMCSMCYLKKSLAKTRGGLLNTSAIPPVKQDTVDPDDDPLESLMVLFSQAVFASGGSGAAVSGIFQSLLDALHEDLAEIADSTAILNLDMDFWVREYQLSVILAALLTAITEDTEPSSSDTSQCIVYVLHLALTLLLRQSLCLRQILDIGEENNPVIIYPLMSLALWSDLWRSKRYLADAFIFSGSDNSKFGKSIESLFACLAQLVRDFSEFKLSSENVGLLADVANDVLPYDISLVGWVSLKSTQRQIRYKHIDNIAIISPSAASSPVLGSDVYQKHANASNIETASTVNKDVNLLPLWSNTKGLMQIALARVQAAILAESERRMIPFFYWDSKGELQIGIPDTSVDTYAYVESNTLNNINDNGLDVTHGDMPAEVSVSSEISDTSCSLNDRLPIRVPDIDAWSGHLATLKNWMNMQTCSLALVSSIHHTLLDETNTESYGLDGSTYVTELLDLTKSLELQKKGLLIVQTPRDNLFGWENVSEYCVFNEDDEDTPTANDVPEEMRAFLACVIELVFVTFVGRDVKIVTDNEELAFYASWFGIMCVSSNGNDMQVEELF